jgi:hypothetical protein
MLMPGRQNLGLQYAPLIDDEIIDWLDANTNVRTIFITGYWLYEATSVTYRHEGTIFADEGYDGSGLAYNPIALENALNRLVRRFPDRQFVFLDDVPTGRELYAKQYLRGVFGRGGLGMEEMTRAEADAQLAVYEPILQRVAGGHANAAYQPLLTELVCDETRCTIFDDQGLQVYFDGDHLAAPYMISVAPVIRDALAPWLVPDGGLRP